MKNESFGNDLGFEIVLGYEEFLEKLGFDIDDTDEAQIVALLEVHPDFSIEVDERTWALSSFDTAYEIYVDGSHLTTIWFNTNGELNTKGHFNRIMSGIERGIYNTESDVIFAKQFSQLYELVEPWVKLSERNRPWR